MLKNFPYLYRGLTLLQIEERLYEQILDAIHDKYGSRPDLLIVTRVQEEWAAIRRRKAAAEVAFLHEFTRWLRAERLPYVMSGSGGTSLILYLLGVTFGNPLPSHLFCPRCGRIQWMPEYEDGFDIPKGQHVCPDDGTVMVGDGHDLSWELLWELEEPNDSLLWIQIPLQVFRLLPKLLENHWLNGRKPAETKLSRWPDTLFLQHHVTFRACLGQDELNDRTCDHNAEANDLDKARCVLAGEIVRHQAFIAEELEIPCPEHFSQIVRRLADQNPCWNVRFLEEAYLELLQKGHGKENALRELNDPSVPLSRAHTIEDLILRIRME